MLILIPSYSASLILLYLHEPSSSLVIYSPMLLTNMQILYQLLTYIIFLVVYLLVTYPYSALAC